MRKQEVEQKPLCIFLQLKLFDVRRVGKTPKHEEKWSWSSEDLTRLADDTGGVMGSCTCWLQIHIRIQLPFFQMAVLSKCLREQLQSIAVDESLSSVFVLKVSGVINTAGVFNNV